MNQQGLLAEKKREGRCSGDYFFFTVCEIHFSGLSKLKEVLPVSEPHNGLTLQVSLSLCDR